jgi:hypothetical protein
MAVAAVRSPLPASDVAYNCSVESLAPGSVLANITLFTTGKGWEFSLGCCFRWEAQRGTVCACVSGRRAGGGRGKVWDVVGG